MFTGTLLKISDITVRDSRAGIVATTGGKIDAANLTVTGNDLNGIDNSRFVKGTAIVASNNGQNTGYPPGFPGIGMGINALRVKIDGLVAEGNAGGGVFAQSVLLKNSSASGNNGFGQGIDILSPQRPRLRTTTCNKSARTAQPLSVVGPWGVCAGD